MTVTTTEAPATIPNSEASAIPATSAATTPTGTTLATGLAVETPVVTPEGTTSTPPDSATADPAAKAAEAPVVPEKYEFKLPEGLPVDQDRLTAFEAMAKEAKLPLEVAQKMIDFAAAGAAQAAEAQKAQVAQWLKDVQADAEMGGGQDRGHHQEPRCRHQPVRIR